MKNLSGSIVLLAMLTSGSFSQPFAPRGGQWVTLQHGPSFDWPQAPGIGPATGPVGKGEVLSLLEAIDAAWVPLTRFDGPVGWSQYSLFDFRFAPLSDGKVYLVAGLGSSNAAGTLEAVYCQQNRCFRDTLGGIADLQTDLVDVDGDGALEVISKECIDDCTGVSRYPTFVYSIYKLIDGKGFTDYSAQAADYYKEHLLPKIEAARNEDGIKSELDRRNAAYRATAAEHGVPFSPPPPGQLEGYEAAAQYAYDDYLRRVLGQKSAGLEDAVRWAASKYLALRQFGLQALARISDPAAGAKLAELARSQDKNLAQTAESFLELRAEFLRGASK